MDKQRRTLLLSGLALLSPITFSYAASQTKTGLVSDPRFVEHLINDWHPESPKRYVALQEQFKLLADHPNIEWLSPSVDPTDWIHTIHPLSHIESLKRQDPDAYHAAVLACSGVLTAAEAVANRQVDNAFCASRPPGHHATDTGKEEGFCYINHVAVAAKYLQQRHGYSKILIVDWDYHHGNGTEWAFYQDASVLFFSTHDALAYPRTGWETRIGDGAGEGFNINIHLPCGSQDEDIISAFQKYLEPAVTSFKPDFILISAGFDSRKDDLLGCHQITDEGFARLTKIVKNLAQTHCQGRLVSVLEGGYNIEGNALSSYYHIRALIG